MLHLQILYEGSELNGRTIFIHDRQVALSEFHTKNYGSHATGPISVRLYLSKQVSEVGSLWQVTSSEEPEYPSCFWTTGASGAVINPQETWNWGSFAGTIDTSSLDSNDVMKGKLKVFYGADKPAVADFTLKMK